MRKHLNKLGLISSALALVVVSGSVVFALPPQAGAHAQAAPAASSSPGGSGGYNQSTNPGSSQAKTGQANGQSHLAAAQLTACQHRETAVQNIMKRFNTRAQNQLTLFGKIATRVEGFYTSKSKKVSNYNQLVAAIATAKTQATTDLSTMQGNSTFSCSANDPKGMVTTFQGYLKTEISDLQNYRTAVKNLIVAVASANGETISASSQSTSAQGGQQ